MFTMTFFLMLLAFFVAFFITVLTLMLVFVTAMGTVKWDAIGRA